jgi:site-specific DNA recombinase
MIADIKAGRVKNVLVFKLDRLTRSVADLVSLMDIFNENGCAFNSLMESLDTSTASGRMFIKIIGIFAEFERENIAERVRVGKERKTREGYTNNSKYKSYGYDRGKGELMQTVNEAEAENVRMIFDMYVNRGMSLSAIAKSFNMQKIPSKMGSIWSAATVKSVITNCNYIGNVRYCINEPDRRFEVEGKHEAIISEELYNAAQILIKKNARTAPTKKPVEENYFANFLFCECGEKYQSHATIYKTKREGKATNHSFICRNRLLKAGCDSKGFTQNKLEAALIEYFSQYEEVFISDSAEAARLELEKRNTDTQIQNYRDKLQHLDKREKEVMNYYINGDIEFDSYREMKKQLESDRDFIRAELAKIAGNESDNNPVTIKREEVAASFRDSWQGLTNAEKRLFLTNYIKKIVVRNEPIEGSRFGNTKIVSIEFNTF